jgi:DNA-binding response OmpR family regulator
MSNDQLDDSRQGPIIIFVVDDEILIVETIRPALEDAGFAVLTASDGDEAIRLLEGENAPLIRALVTDIDLGTEVRGWDVARRARELHPTIPVVFITGGNADEWAARGVPNSVLICKPFVPVQVVTAVSQLLNAAPPPPELSTPNTRAGP